MAPPSSKDRKQQLQMFAQKHLLDTNYWIPRKAIPELKTTYKIQQDIIDAQAMLRESKADKLKSMGKLRRALLSTSERTIFSSKEIHEQLGKAVRYNSSPGLVEVLRDLLNQAGGNFNFCSASQQSTRGLVHRGPPREIRTQYLRLAVENENAKFVQMLVAPSDQYALNESLDRALKNKLLGETDPNRPKLIIPELLLAYGGNAANQELLFLKAIELQDMRLLQLLVKARNPISKENLSKGLLSAVRIKSLAIITLLVNAGANGNGADGKGEALRQAIGFKDQNLLLPITLCETPPTPQTLDQGMGIVFGNGIQNLSEQLPFGDILLSSGAKGNHTWNFMTAIIRHMVTTQKDEQILIPMLKTIIFNAGEGINYRGGEALKLAVSNTRMDLFNILIKSGSMEKKVASDAYAMINPKATDQEKFDIATRLIDKGARGAVVSDSLIAAVKIGHLEVIEMLVNRHSVNAASVNHKEAHALRDAVSREQFDIILLLLKARPTEASLGFAFAQIQKVPKDNRLKYAQVLLNAGAKGVEVDKALWAAIASSDAELIRLLVSKGAAVDPHVETAVAKGDAKLLEILLANAASGRPSPAVKLKALQSAVAYREKEAAHELVRLLLVAKVDVSSENGKVILQAVRACKLEILDLLLEVKPQIKLVNSAFALAILNPDVEICASLCMKLLDAGAAGVEVDKALGVAVNKEKVNSVLQETLASRASVNFDGGRALVCSINRGCQIWIKLLLSKNPGPLTLHNAVEEALKVKNEDLQYQIFEWMSSAKLPVDTMNSALLTAAKLNLVPLSGLCLKYGAQLNFRDGAPFKAAITSHNSALLKSFVSTEHGKASAKTLNAGLTLCLTIQNGEDKQVLLAILLSTGYSMDVICNSLCIVSTAANVDIPTVEQFLQNGADVHRDDSAALSFAVRERRIELLGALLKFANDKTAVTKVFAETMRKDKFWGTAAGLKITSMLLQKSQKGETLNQALLTAVSNLDIEKFGEQAFQLATALLENGADVNFKDGLVLRIAIAKGFKRMAFAILKKECDSHTLSYAFPYILNSKLEEELVVKLINTFARSSQQEFQKPFAHPDPKVGLPIVAWCIRWNPKSVKILQAVLSAGFPIDDNRCCQVTTGEKTHHCTPMVWALSSQLKEISEDVLALMVTSNASLEGTLCDTILHDARHKGQYLLLQALVNANTDINRRNNEGVTAFECALLAGDVQSMKILILGGCKVADNALHIAARQLDTEAISVLINLANSDVNKLSIEHDGRSPLAELLLTAPDHAKSITDETVKNAIELLIKSGAKTDVRFPNYLEGKSLLFHALDSRKSLFMAKAFLECDDQYKHINEVYNLFNDGQYTYSATAYIGKNLCANAVADVIKINKLLTNFGMIGRFWRNEGEQPSDMRNPPLPIKQAHDKLENEKLEAKIQEARLQRELDAIQRKHQLEKQMAIEMKMINERQ